MADDRTVFDTLDAGDRILYSDKQQPLTITSVADDEIRVKGPQGGTYVLFVAPDNDDMILESKSGNKEYARKVTDLRKVGRWEETALTDEYDEGEAWAHTKSGAQVRVVKNQAGHWTVEIDDFDGDMPDIPAYGYLSKDQALEEAETFMEKHPEG